MMQIPTLAAIDAAELRVLQSRRMVQQSLDSTRKTLRAALARPSNLVLVAVASGIFGFLLTHRRRPAVKSVPNSANSTRRAPGGGLVRWLVSMYGARVMTMALQIGAAAGKKSGASVNATMPSTSAGGSSATI